MSNTQRKPIFIQQLPYKVIGKSLNGQEIMVVLEMNQLVPMLLRKVIYKYLDGQEIMVVLGMTGLGRSFTSS